MMNFLDLSTASEEERRLISELLSDTSVVNFAQPIEEQQQEYTEQQHQQQLSQVAHQANRSRQQTNQHHYHQNQQHNHQIVNTKTAHHQYHLHLHQQHPPHVQQNPATATTNSNNANQILNHVHNHDTPVTSENQHLTNDIQMPTQMAGDINSSVVGLDMAGSQHAGYPLPHPPSAHVPQTYGPPHHHMYGGPPIFQYTMPIPYPNIVYGNMSPYPVLLAPNSVVTPRQQQIPPQTSQPPNTSIATSSHSRSHLHHSRHNKMKEHMSKQSLQQHQQNPANNANQAHFNSHSNNNLNEVVLARPNETDSDSLENDHKLANNGSHLYNDAVPHVDYKSNDTESTNRSKPDQQQRTNDVKIENGITLGKKEDEINKISSDEGFDTQTSSLDVSKQSQDSPSVPIEEKSKTSPSEVECNSTLVEQTSSESSESTKTERRAANHNNDDKASHPGPWGPSSSKSWASLFKGDGSTLSNSPLNGEAEQNNLELSTSDEDSIKNLQKKPLSSEKGAQSSSRSITSKEQRSQDAARRALDKMAPRLAQRIQSITLKHSLPLLRPRGFINKGNGCYINSTLQALIACPPFYNLMKEIGDLKCLRRENSCTPILDSFAELFLNFPPLSIEPGKKSKQFSSSDQRIQMNNLQAEPLEPKCIYDVLGQIKSECLRGAQEDAEEFLSSVLNGLHEEMIGLSEISQSNQSNNSSSQNGHQSDVDDPHVDVNNDENLWREVGPKNRSLPIRSATVVNTPIQEIFGGSLFSIRTAGKDRCGHRSPFFDLQLDISGDDVKSLQDAIKSFTATEVIHDFYCSKTKQNIDAQRTTSLDQLPPILILHLKQFVYTQDHGLKKLMKRIEYPIDFELPEACLHEKNSEYKKSAPSRTYKLLAVVYHEGKEAVKGHYLTDVYHIGSSHWIRCDDSNLRVVSSPRIDNSDSSRTPYLLFYRRLNTLKSPQSNISNNYHDNNKKRS